MVRNVARWLEFPGGSFGWLLKGNEGPNATAKRFDTRENATPANRPMLTITYMPPSS